MYAIWTGNVVHNVEMLVTRSLFGKSAEGWPSLGSPSQVEDRFLKLLYLLIPESVSLLLLEKLLNYQLEVVSDPVLNMSDSD